MKAPKTLLSMVYNYMEESRCCTFPTMVRDIASGQEPVLWLPCVVAKQRCNTSHVNVVARPVQKIACSSVAMQASYLFRVILGAAKARLRL